MYCALCLEHGGERQAITVKHGLALCDLHLRETDKKIAQARREVDALLGPVSE